MLSQQRVISAPRMTTIAGPSVVIRSLNKSCANRIEFNVAQTSKPIPLRIDDGRTVPPFEQTARSVVTLVEVTHIATSDRLHRLRDGVGLLRRQHQVHVVRHQHVRIQGHWISTARIGDTIEEPLAIVEHSKDVRFVVSSLDHVLGEANDARSKEASHALTCTKCVHVDASQMWPKFVGSCLGVAKIQSREHEVTGAF